jgi:hypothetical protein
MCIVKPLCMHGSRAAFSHLHNMRLTLISHSSCTGRLATKQLAAPCCCTGEMLAFRPTDNLINAQSSVCACVPAFSCCCCTGKMLTFSLTDYHIITQASVCLCLPAVSCCCTGKMLTSSLTASHVTNQSSVSAYLPAVSSAAV